MRLDRGRLLIAATNEKGRIRGEQDEKLFAETHDSMMKMADELEGETCYCEICSLADGLISNAYREQNSCLFGGPLNITSTAL